jgi:hypothetical protein
MRILGAFTDEKEWDSLFNRLPERLRDVHFSSGYARVQASLGGTAVAAVIEFVGGVFILQPFLVSPIPGHTDYYDIKSFYGYGGLISNSVVDPALGLAFTEELRAWARQNGVVSEYCCLHPLFAPNQLPFLRHENVEFIKNVVVIDNLADFTTSRRIRRAVTTWSLDCDIYVAKDAIGFAELYNLSMQRLVAASHWKYPLRYWTSHLNEEVGTFFFLRESSIVRRGLLVIGCPENNIAYAHFLGSDGEYDLDSILYQATAKLLSIGGYKRFHLGGGLTPDPNDKLLFFKSGFSKAMYTVGVYRRIFQSDVYNSLCNEIGENKEGRFPAYRL